MSMSQKECVYQAVFQVIDLQDVDGAVKPSKDQLQEIYSLVAEKLSLGEANFSDEAKTRYPTLESIRKEYVPGMVSNWLRKDVRLNGGEPYKTKNPGSRAGQGDEILRNLKALKSTLSDAEQVNAVQTEIDKRIAELAAAKSTKVTIDLDKIPAELRAQLGL